MTITTVCPNSSTARRSSSSTSPDEFGQTVVMVTHEAAAAAIADRVLVLVDGRIVADEPAGTAERIHELMTQPA